MDKFKIELEHFVKFCEKIVMYNINTLSPGSKHGPINSEIDNFKLVIERLYSKKPEYFISVCKKLFLQLEHDFEVTDELASIEFLKNSNIELVVGQTGKSKIRIGTIYSKCCDIYDRVASYIEKEKKTDEERQELNYPMAFLYHLFKIFNSLILGKGDYREGFDESILISNKESVQMIGEYVSECERFLGIKQGEVNSGEMMSHMTEILGSIPKEIVRESAASAGKIPNITQEEMSAAFNGILKSGIMEKIVGSVSGSMEKGDIGGMFTEIMKLTQDPDVFKVVSESIEGCEKPQQKEDK